MEEKKLLKEFIDLYYRMSLEDFEINLTNENISLRFLENHHVINYTKLYNFINELNTIIEVDFENILFIKESDNLDMFIPFKNNNEKKVN